MKIIRLTPACKDYPWGGALLREKYGVNSDLEPLAEAWALSCHPDGESIIAEGEHQGQRLSGCAAQYGANFWGTKCEEFDGLPLLIKLIDAKTNLSIQVHPDNAYALEHEHQYGKTEMWYVVGHEEGAKLYLGFNQPVDRAKYLEYLEAGRLAELLNAYTVADGDSYFIPSGTIHAIGKGLLIAEIQQTSDITYRVFDWNRVDPKTGKGRELHTELALDAIEYKARSDYKTVAAPRVNAPVTLEKCPYFQTNSLIVDGTAERDYAPLDSFVIYICLDGQLELEYEGGSVYYDGEENFANEQLKVIGAVNPGDTEEYTGALATDGETQIKGNLTTSDAVTALVIPAKSDAEKYDLAWKFIRWVAGPEGQAILAKTGNVVPNQDAIALSDTFYSLSETKNYYAPAVMSRTTDVGDWGYFENGEWVTDWSGDFNDKLRMSTQTLSEFLAANETAAQEACASTTMRIKGWR